MKRNLPGRGFSLVEVMFALTIILVGLAGVTGALIFGMGAGRHGDTMATASHHARTLIETAAGRDYISLAADLSGPDGMPGATSGLNDDDAADPVALDAAPFEAVFLPDANIQPFRRKIRTVRKGAKGTIEGSLALMTVEIFWDEKGVERSVEITAALPHTLDNTP